MIAAIVLAAGLSRRMGQPKMLLPWGHSTVIGTVVDTVKQLESQGFQYDNAEASFELLLNKARPGYVPPFDEADLACCGVEPPRREQASQLVRDAATLPCGHRASWFTPRQREPDQRPAAVSSLPDRFGATPYPLPRQQ